LLMEVIQRIIHHNTYKFIEKAGVRNPMILGFCLLKGGHTQLASKLERGYTYEVDVSSMDLSLSRQIMEFAYAGWLHIMKIPRTKLTEYEERHVCASKLMKVGGHVELVDEGARSRLGLNPSGHFLTTIINSFATLYVNYLFAVRVVKQAPTVSDYQDSSVIRLAACSVVSAVHGDDALFSLVDKVDGANTLIRAAYEECGLSCKKVDGGEVGLNGRSFLGFIWQQSGYDYKLVPAFTARIFMRLKHPLRHGKLNQDKLEQQLNSLAIMSVNDLKFTSGLEEYAFKKNIKLFPVFIRKAIMDGNEKLVQGYDPAKFDYCINGNPEETLDGLGVFKEFTLASAASVGERKQPDTHSAECVSGGGRGYVASSVGGGSGDRSERKVEKPALDWESKWQSTDKPTRPPKARQSGAIPQEIIAHFQSQAATGLPGDPGANRSPTGASPIPEQKSLGRKKAGQRRRLQAAKRRLAKEREQLLARLPPGKIADSNASQEATKEGKEKAKTE
jgi:hypothetical protein